MEMGDAWASSPGEGVSWTSGLQHAGRIVSVSNGMIFDELGFNYSRDFPYIWAKIQAPIANADDQAAAE